MRVRKDSWHYRLVQHKKFVSDPSPDDLRNQTINYIIEIWNVFVVALGAPILIGLMFLHAAGSFHLFSENQPLMIVFTIFITSPLWVLILLAIINLFASKEWRQLDIIDF